MRPNHHLLSEAMQAHQAGQLARAERGYRQILAQAPQHAEANHLLGLLCSQQGQHREAVRYLQQAIAAEGDNPGFHNNLGEVWRRQGELEKAIGQYRQALALSPQVAEFHYNLANALKQQGQLTEAIGHYRQAIGLKPHYANAHYNLGNALLEQGQFKSAMACYQQALTLNPALAEAHNNLGIALQEWDRLDEAISRYRRAAQLKPDFIDAHRNLGLVLEKQGKLEEARQSYQRVLALEPGNTLFRLHVETLGPIIAASSADIDQYRTQLMATLERYRGCPLPVDLRQLQQLEGAPPASLIYHGRDDRSLKVQWAALFKDSFPTQPRQVGQGKPHIGFVVTHGHEGVFIKCMRGLINQLPEARFKLTLVCSRQAGEQILRPAITHPAVGYLPLASRFDQALAQVNAAQFDLLHYWEVGTDATNYFLPFCRPAPVQCATWGWPVTTGIPQMDYFISSALLETADSDAHYSETLIRLNRLPTYYYRPPIPATPPPRSRFGLPERQNLYFCPQNLRKIHPDFDALVAAILRRDPLGLVLFIEDQQPAITEQLRRRLQTTLAEVLTRVRFLPRMTEADYLGLTALAAVILDTPHYGGGANTTYDALAAGTPVVTLPTRFHRGRYAYAAYRQMGLSDGVADSAEAYIDKALHIGTDPAYRATLSAQLSAACGVLFEDREAVTELADFFEAAVAAARR